MRSIRTFRANAAAGGALVTVLLAVGMGASIHDFDAIASAQIEHIRAQEQEITLVERLRWSGELIVSAGRGDVVVAIVTRTQGGYQQQGNRNRAIEF